MLKILKDLILYFFIITTSFQNSVYKIFLKFLTFEARYKKWGEKILINETSPLPYFWRDTKSFFFLSLFLQLKLFLSQISFQILILNSCNDQNNIRFLLRHSKIIRHLILRKQDMGSSILLSSNVEIIFFFLNIFLDFLLNNKNIKCSRQQHDKQHIETFDQWTKTFLIIFLMCFLSVLWKLLFPKWFADLMRKNTVLVLSDLET
jgi:hypothetical protein